ncbi:hypothetical protein J7M28_08590 [bacterium]|nr:hypothetical protein [bacterium]
MVSLQSSLSILFKRDRVILTHLGKGFTKYTLLQHEVIDLNGSEDRSEEHLDIITQNGISHFLEQHKIKPDCISIGIPRSSVFFAFIKLPKVQGANVKDLLDYEIERHVPLPSSAIYYDGQVVGEAGQDGGLLNIAIVAAPRGLVERYANIVSQIGLTPSSIKVAALGLSDFFNLFESPLNGSSMALVDCDETEADVLILKGGELRHCRTISLECESQAVHGTSSEANRISETGDYGILGAGEMAESPGFRDDMTTKRAQCILDELAAYADGSAENTYIDEICLSGEYRSTLLLQGALSELGFSGRVRTLQPNIRMRSMLSADKASSLCPAIGLGTSDLDEAKGGINLLPPELRASRTLYGKKFMIGLSIALCLMLMGGISSSVIKKKMAVDFLQTKVNSLEDEVKLIAETRSKSREWSSLLKELRLVGLETLNPLLVLKELDRLLPHEGEEKVWLTNFRLKGTSLSIDGLSDKPEGILGRLEESPLFMNAGFEGRTTSRKDTERFGVVLEIDLAGQSQLLEPQLRTEIIEEPLGPLPPEGFEPLDPDEFDEELEDDLEHQDNGVQNFPLRNPLLGPNQRDTFEDDGLKLPLRSPLGRRYPATGSGASRSLDARDDADETEEEQD